MSSTSHVYSLRLDHRSLLELLLYLEIKNIRVDSVSGAIRDFILLKTAEIRPALEAIHYLQLTDTEVLEAIAARVEIVGRQRKDRALGRQTAPRPLDASPVTPVRPKTVTNLDFSPESFGQNFVPELPAMLTAEELYPVGDEAFSVDEVELLLQEEIAGIEAAAEADLLSKLTGGFSVAPAKEAEAKEKALPTISERDPRLAKDKFWKQLQLENDPIKMHTLRILYYNLPFEHWSTEKAEEMYLNLLRSRLTP